MADYRTMYLELFRATTQAIELLQKAQQKTEEIYVSTGDTVQLCRKMLAKNADQTVSGWDKEPKR